MKTYFAKKEDFGPDTRAWYHVDAKDKVLGRMAAEIATLLMGKNRADYTPHVDTGAYVVVTNAAHVRLTGKKMTDKEYERYSGYSGGRKIRKIPEMLEKKPDDVVRLAVKGMLPRGRLGRSIMSKLKVYPGPEHPHTYQKPEKVDVSN